jgi:hypothetical protein
MTVTIELTDEQAAILKERANAQGMSVENWLKRQAGLDAPPDSGSVWHLQTTDPEAWAREFEAWLDEIRPDVPVLSDEAMSRATIYDDRE